MAGQLALQQFQHGAYLTCTGFFYPVPAYFTQRLDLDVNMIERRAADDGLDFTLEYFQMANRTIANISLAAGQAVGIVAERLQVFTPGRFRSSLAVSQRHVHVGYPSDSVFV